MGKKMDKEQKFGRTMKNTLESTKTEREPVMENIIIRMVAVTKVVGIEESKMAKELKRGQKVAHM